MKVQSQMGCPTHLVFHEVEIPTHLEHNYFQWREGKIRYIQDALPELSAADREILISGQCQESWDGMFAKEPCDDECDGSKHPGLFCRD